MFPPTYLRLDKHESDGGSARVDGEKPAGPDHDETKLVECSPQTPPQAGCHAAPYTPQKSTPQGRKQDARQLEAFAALPEVSKSSKSSKRET